MQRSEASAKQLCLAKVMRVEWSPHEEITVLVKTERPECSHHHVKKQQEGNHLHARKGLVTKNLTTLAP